MKRDKNIFQQKSFYFAMYAAIITFSILISAMAYRNLKSISSRQFKIAEQPKKTNQKTDDKDLVKPVLSNKTKSYLAPEDRKENQETTEDKKSKSTTENLTQAKKENPEQKVIVSPQTKLYNNQNKINSKNLVADASVANKTAANKKENKITENIKNKTEKIKESTQINTQSTNKDQTKILVEPEKSNLDETVSFNYFDPEQKMDWPMFGEIVMDYDDQNLVYDKTLEQYRTNDCISLAAQIGEQVKAVADGIVKSVLNTPESGNTIILDHGNGWSTTYSQLQDDLLVNQGDTVKKGQVIGGVGSPTKYGILLGSHLDFRVAHNDSYVNPKSIMVER